MQEQNPAPCPILPAAGYPIWCAGPGRETCIMGTCLLACTPMALGFLPFEGGFGTFFFKSVVAA